MKTELDQYLTKKYPNIFCNRNANKLDSDMYWGFQCGDGWFFIIDMLCSSINKHIDVIKQKNKFHQEMLDKINAGQDVPDWIKDLYNKGNLEIKAVPEVIANQVKEKIGTLRFYCDGADEVIKGMILMAESMSKITCEECGNMGTRRESGWIRTLCDKHAKSKKKKEDFNVGDTLYVLDVGEYIQIKITKIINQEEIIGFKVEKETDNKNKNRKYYCAKYLNNTLFPYWDAQKFDG